MVRENVGHVAEPKVRDPGEDFTFAGNRLRHDDIERGEAIGGDDQKMLSQIVDIADFPAFQKPESWKAGF
jgi:hypothetical protein